LTQFQQSVLNEKHSGTKEDVQRMMVVTEKAKTQVDRDDKPFTKNDWIAVLVAVGEIELKEMEAAEKIYTVPELMAMIRGNVYNPNRYFTGHKSIQNGVEQDRKCIMYK